jgi:hypothetical protein
MAGYVQRLLNRLEGIPASDAMVPGITRRQVGNGRSTDPFGSIYETIPTQAAPLAGQRAPLARAVAPPKEESGPARFLPSGPGPIADTTKPARAGPYAAAVDDVDSITAFQQPGPKREVSFRRRESAPTPTLSRPLVGEPVPVETLVLGTPRGDVGPSDPAQAGKMHMQPETVSSLALRPYASQPTNRGGPIPGIKPNSAGMGHDDRGAPGLATPSSTTNLPEQRRTLSVAPAELVESNHSAPVRPKGTTQVHIGSVHVHLAEQGTIPPAPLLQDPHPKRTVPIHRAQAAGPRATHYGLGQM